MASALATKIAHQTNAQARAGCMVVTMSTYPLPPDPADALAVLHADHAYLVLATSMDAARIQVDQLLRCDERTPRQEDLADLVLDVIA